MELELNWVRLQSGRTHLGSGEFEFNQILLSLKMLDHKVSNFAHSAFYEFGYNIITDMRVDEISASYQMIEQIAPIVTLIYHKGDMIDLEATVVACENVFGKDNFRILKRISNNIRPSVWNLDHNVIDLGAFFLKPTPHYFVEKFAPLEFIAPSDDYALMMIGRQHLSNVADFRSFFNEPILCLCENTADLAMLDHSAGVAAEFRFHPYLDYGSVEWFRTMRDADHFCEPNSFMTCSSIEALYLNKVVLFTKPFKINEKYFGWSECRGGSKLSAWNSEVFHFLDLRAKLIEVLRLV